MTFRAPGVYPREVFLTPPPGLRTAVPVFLGFVRADDPVAAALLDTPQALTAWPQFSGLFGLPFAATDSYLPRAVAGFFDNGGRLCYVLLTALDATPDPVAACNRALDIIAPLDTIDLVCAPDIMRPAQPGTSVDDAEVRAMQAAVLAHCDNQGDRFAILDASATVTSVDDVLQQRAGLEGTNGALYYPWIVIRDQATSAIVAVPPCGHVAGIYARSDERIGVHKAPANEVIEGVLDLKGALNNDDQARLNPVGVNCLRAFPGRGIRVWGARTLSAESAWTYVNVRRLFLTAGRWIEQSMANVVFEPNDLRLWTRINRELTVYFTDLFRAGALQGSTPQEAFYVKCDAETNPPEVRDAGEVVVEVGLAPTRPAEFVVLRIIRRASGITITGPIGPGQ